MGNPIQSYPVTSNQIGGHLIHHIQSHQSPSNPMKQLAYWRPSNLIETNSYRGSHTSLMSLLYVHILECFLLLVFLINPLQK